jgi:hypothetical protein
MRSREIHGEGVDHEQDYVQERIVNASDTKEYGTAAEELEEELHDLRSAEGQSPSETAELQSEAINRTAVMPTDRMDFQQGDDLDPARASSMDPEQQPPTAEARTRTARQFKPNLGE